MDNDDRRPTTDNVSSACDDVNQDQQYGRGSTSASYAILYSMCTMRALQVDRLQKRRDLAAAETGEDREAH